MEGGRGGRRHAGLVSLEEGEIQGFDHYDKADTFQVDRVVSEVTDGRLPRGQVFAAGSGISHPPGPDEDAVRFAGLLRRVGQARGGSAEIGSSKGGTRPATGF